jgi:hypothetical protein
MVNNSAVDDSTVMCWSCKKNPPEKRHSPCCSAHGEPYLLCCKCYCRSHFVEVNQCSPESHRLVALSSDQAMIEIVHRCPLEGEGLTPCCGRTPFELDPWGSRMTLDDSLVTCKSNLR